MTNADMDFLRTEMEIGMSIILYGTRTPNPAGITGATTFGTTAA